LGITASCMKRCQHRNGWRTFEHHDNWIKNEHYPNPTFDQQFDIGNAYKEMLKN